MPGTAFLAILGCTCAWAAIEFPRISSTKKMFGTPCEQNKIPKPRTSTHISHKTQYQKMTISFLPMLVAIDWNLIYFILHVIVPGYLYKYPPLFVKPGFRGLQTQDALLEVPRIHEESPFSARRRSIESFGGNSQPYCPEGGVYA